MMAETIAVDERSVMKKAVITLQIIVSPKHKILKRFGLWIAKIGLLIAGFGEVKITDEE